MMIKKILFFSILLVSSNLLISQQRLVSFINDLKTTTSNLKDAIPIVNEKTGEIGYFIVDAKNVYGYKLNSEFQVIDKMVSEEKSREYKTLIGSSVSESNSYRVFLTNKNKNKFSSINFSFENKISSSSDFIISSEENFIQTIDRNNQFYLITGSKLNYDIYIYTFDENGVPKKNLIEINIIDNKKNLSIIPILINSGSIKKIEDNTPISIELASEKVKMYSRENLIVFTTDNNNKFTQVFEIDLNTFQSSFNRFNKPIFEGNSTKTNSFLNGDVISTLAVNKENLSIDFLNYKTGELIKNLTVNADETIIFKNTPIIQEGGSFEDYRELEKTKQFLRKISSSNAGISFRKFYDKFHVVIGGYVIQRTNGAMMMPFGGIPIAGIGNVTVFFNPTQLAFNSASNNKATRIECLFDQEFNHFEGIIGKNAFDKMQDYSIKNPGETVFKYKNYFINVDYHLFSNEVIFRKFED
ncbi:hypothetical protein [Polaribacter gangjinensis]|uniref:Uncharacterized protein n=1 Tax=Polaribacter gangjinensis TaxID=574710 RepID=A0A2S7WEB5_9FLAO|nr:hypothetical protein [Polaribacter gangjinensis]PQJ75592.1 hypothetical protein BTO13_10280 [Polaribacter gangjinensis]